MKPGPLAKYTFSNFTADKAKLNPVYPAKDLHKPHPRYKLAAAGTTYIRNPYNPIDMNNVSFLRAAMYGAGREMVATPAIAAPIEPEGPNVAAHCLKGNNANHRKQRRRLSPNSP